MNSNPTAKPQNQNNEDITQSGREITNVGLLVGLPYTIGITQEPAIPKRFRMMNCKAMTTPMASNLKLFSVASSELVDAMMYC